MVSSVHYYKLSCVILFSSSASNLTTQQECIPVGCVPSTAMAVFGRGCLPTGVFARGRVSARGWLPGGCLPGEGVSARHRPLWTEWQTGVKTLPCRNYVADGNEEITLPVKLIPHRFQSYWSLYSWIGDKHTLSWVFEGIYSLRSWRTNLSLFPEGLKEISSQFVLQDLKLYIPERNSQ